jgi:hypothetical protein
MSQLMEIGWYALYEFELKFTNVSEEFSVSWNGKLKNSANLPLGIETPSVPSHVSEVRATFSFAECVPIAGGDKKKSANVPSDEMGRRHARPRDEPVRRRSGHQASHD